MNVVRQIAPISTSNYAGNNAFVKLVGCLDTLGSMGKWARSTRTLERPDLPAGSGLVIPAPLLEHLRRTRGSPWDGTTITEDARLVISDYGLLDGATQRTKFVPVHLLEAVPEGPTVLGVFKQYWAQRMRWASGGPDEIRQLLRAFRTDHLYVNTRSPDGRFQLRRRGRWERMLARSRHLWMLLRWTGDHFWWGPGYGLAPLVWLTFDFFYPTPRLFRIIGCSMLFGLPAWTLFGVFRRFAPFVPGGLQWQDLIRLYLTALLLALFLPWPVMHTHILYLLGRTSRFKGWAATPKPQY